MPLNTQIIRDGKPLPVEGGYSWWHLNRLADAIQQENPTKYDADGHLLPQFNPDEFGPFPYGYKFTQDHVFTDVEENIWVRGIEVGKLYRFEIKAGDTYNCWR